MKAETSKVSIAQYKSFRDFYNPNSVLYPSCGFDVSPSEVFDNVTYVDLEDGNEGCINALKSKGLNAIKGNIRDYTPKESHDLLILQNPCLYQDGTLWATQHLANEGHIISNNYHGNATFLNKQRGFVLIGTLDTTETEGEFEGRFSEDLTDLFVPVKTLDELKERSPENYTFTNMMINSLRRQGIIEQGLSQEEAWRQYLEIEGGGIPLRRSASNYIFIRRGKHERRK